MQAFELLLIIVGTLYLLFHRTLNNRIKLPYVVGGLIVVLLLHMIFEAFRWQMIPAYLIWTTALFKAFNRPKEKSSTTGRALKSVGLIILLVPGFLLPSVLPVFHLPKPSGPYTVGTSDIYLDLERDEPITADTTDTRKIMVKAWYPSKDSSGELDPYVDQGGRVGFAKKYGLAPFMLQYLDQVDTHVYRDTRVADESFPVIIFFHGYNSKANGYYAMLSEIVSQGYVIFAVNHTYESTGTIFPDGTVATFDYEYARNIEADTWKIITPVIEAFESGHSFEERHPIVREALTTYFGRDIVERWAQDLADVTDQLSSWNSFGMFKDKLDLSKVGALGHSRGGGAAGELTLIDNRIKAGANLDGVQWGQIVIRSFNKPFLFLSSDWPEDHENLIPHAYVNKSRSIFYEGLLLNSGHSNFMDIPFMVPVQALSMAGNIDPNLATDITTELLTSFFDKYLKSIDLNLQSISSEYELLELTIHEEDTLR
jgi:predicted dienelactone hydrolase